jgi:ethanolamine utilization protein EutA (predicted chaperonin)
LSIADKNSAANKRKVLAEKSQEVINEARDFVSSTQQALIILEKNDTKAALAILKDISKKLAVILDKNSALASVTAEMEAGHYRL